MPDAIVRYSKTHTGRPSSYLFQIKYKKSVTLVDITDIEGLTETYTIENGIHPDVILTLTHSVIGNEITVDYHYEEDGIFTSSGEVGTFLVSQLDMTIEVDIWDDAGTVICNISWYDSENVRHNLEQNDLSSSLLIDMSTKIEFAVTQVTGSFRYITYEIDYFKVETDEAAQSSQTVGDIIYPDTELLNSTSLHEGDFQNTEIIEAAKMKNTLFVATGTKLLAVRFVTSPITGVVYLVSQEVDKYAYEPNTQQSVIGGLNLIKANPFLSLLDTTGSYSWNPDQIRFREQFGVAGQDNYVRAALTIQSSTTVDDYEFKWEYQETDTDDLSVWTTHQDFAEGEEGRSVILNLLKPKKYNILLTMRKIATPSIEKTKYLFNYEVSSVDKNIEYDVSDTNDQINTCKKIIQFYNKIIVYDNGTSNIYKSFSGKETWFALSGIIPFTNLRQENLKKIITLDDALLGFTENSITALLGKGDDIQYEGYPYEPFTGFTNVDQNVGAVAPESVTKLADGSVVFLSNSGLRMVNDFDFSTKKSRSVAIDTAINNVIDRDADACGISYNNAYYLAIPAKNRIFKWHYNFEGIFSMDESSKLTFSIMYNLNGRLLGINAADQILRKRVIVNTTFKTLSELEYSGQGYFADDGEIYDAQIGTKDLGFDFDANYKRMFMFFIGFNSVIDEQIKLFINLYADDTTLINVLENENRVEEDEDGFEIFDNETISQNAEGDLGIFLGDWELGQQALGFVETTYRHYNILKTRAGYRARVVISHQQDAPVQIFHLGFIYQVGYIPRDR